MINQIKTSLFFLILIVFLLSTSLGFASTKPLVPEDDNLVIVMSDGDDKDKDDDDDKDDKHKLMNDDDKDKDDKDDKGDKGK